jgi:DNA segregation ATPase FtsK/SpoIIIE, S-DNA-T family
VNRAAIIAATLAEAGWWVHRPLSTLRRRPGHVVVMIAAIWLTLPAVPAIWLVAASVSIVALRLWAVLSAPTFHRVVIGPAQRHSRRRLLHRRWAELATCCGLGVEVPASVRSGEGSRPRDTVSVPELIRVHAEGPRIHVRVRPLLGQTFEDIEKASERLRTAVGATHVRTARLGPNQAVVTFTIGDALAAPFAASRPDASPVLGIDVLMGRVEDGSDWRLPIGPHTLVAGCSGAGKGSVFWSFAFGLAPAVRTGLVRLHGVDLKGGMEILMGAELFTKRATNAAEAVTLLEELVSDMGERTRKYAGRIRSHTPSTEEPLHVVMIDELAALTAYCPERDLQRRAELAINLLCSQGRAPGFVVFACLQDPRKEVIPSRGLFTQMVGLRLKDLNETAMVLGETAVSSGAHCHRITRETPGIGYVVPEDAGYPIRVRAGFVSDQAIQSVAAEFRAPVHEPVVVREPSAEDQLNRLHRTRAHSSGAI